MDQALFTRRPDFARWLGGTNDVTRMFLSAGNSADMINMAGGLPDPGVYPVDALAEIARAAVAEHATDSLNYSPIEGLPALRDAIARRFSDEHLKLTRDNVLITTAGLQGLDLLGKVLIDEGGLIAAHSPTYLGAIDAWRARLPAYRPFHPESNEFDARAALDGAQFAYTVPNFSNPTGKLIGLERRRALVVAAHETGTWLVEDDPYGALYYEGEPLPRLLSLSGAMRSGQESYAGPVVYLGTLSKELAPGLRIGWIVAAPELIAALTMAKQGSDMCSSGLTQRVALDAFAVRLPETILPGILALYKGRRDALCAALEAHLAPWFAWEKPVGGMFVWAVARDPAFDTDRLLKAALEEGVCVTPSSVFDVEGRNRRAIRINFTLNAAERLSEGVRRLARAAATVAGEGKAQVMQDDQAR